MNITKLKFAKWQLAVVWKLQIKKLAKLKWKSSPYVNKRFVYILNCCIFLNDVLSEYLTPFWFAMLLNEYEIEFMFRKI